VKYKKKRLILQNRRLDGWILVNWIIEKQAARTGDWIPKDWDRIIGWLLQTQ